MGTATSLMRAMGAWAAVAVFGFGIACSSESKAAAYTVIDLGTLGGPNSSGQGINDSGQVTGISRSAGDTAYHAFLYSGGVMADLNDLIDPASGWTLRQAYAINDSGWITGHGSNSAGQVHAFLLTPVPEPATLGLLAIGGLVIIRRRR